MVTLWSDGANLDGGVSAYVEGAWGSRWDGLLFEIAVCDECVPEVAGIAGKEWMEAK